MINKCEICNKNYKVKNKYLKYKFSLCSKECRKIFFFKNPELTSNWKGGIRKESRGYLQIKSPLHPFCNNRGYVMEHRLKIEKEEGRILGKKEIVHHINFKRDDNRLENLYLCKNISEHQKIHFSIRKIVYPLIKKGIIVFDKKEGEYKINESIGD